MSDAPYFRAGAGAVIYTETGEIVIFRRAGEEDIWQLQQGGMDANETPEDTLWRELYEETDLLKANFIEVTPYPDWILYSYPPEVRTTLKRPDTLGQVHRWWFLKLNPEVKIDLTKAFSFKSRESKNHCRVDRTNTGVLLRQSYGYLCSTTFCAT